MTRKSAMAGTALRTLRRRLRPGAAGGGLSVESVQLVRFVGPGRSLGRSHGLLVQLQARAASTGAELMGLGEAVVYPGQADAAWRQVRRLATSLVGSTLPEKVSSVDPLARVDGWRAVRGVDRAAVRAAKLAVEMALIDLLMKAAGLAPDGWWNAGERPALVSAQPVHKAPGAAPDSPRDNLSAVLGADPGASWAVKLKASGDPQLDLAWLRRADEVERSAGRNRPLWLTGLDLEPVDAEAFVRQVGELLAAGELAAEVLLEEPLTRTSAAKVQERAGLTRLWNRPRLARLQEVADRTAGEGRLVIVASDSVSSLAQVRALCAGPMVGGLHLSLARFGSLVDLRRAAQLARRRAPTTKILLAGGRGSRLTSIALEALATGTPEIERYLPEVAGAGWPSLALTEDPEEQDGEAPRAGLFAGVDVGELASVADRLAATPDRPQSVVGATPNRFTGHPLLGVAMSPRSMLLEVEALRLGWRTRRFARDYFLADRAASTPGAPPATIGFVDSESSATSVAASVIALRKSATRDLLAEQGLPVPEGSAFPADAHAKAREFGLALGFPLVVKPGGGSKGTAVTPNVQSEPELVQALTDVAACPYAESGVVVERFVTGNDHRVLATADEVLSVVRRDPASVVGDGQRTVEELVLASNVARRQNPHLARRLIPLDTRVDAMLRRQELTRRSVLAAGQRVQLSAAANLHQGGDSHELLDSTHPSLLALAKAAVAAIPGLPHAGLDILLEDHQRPVDEQSVHIIEINSRAVQTVHHFPMFGPPRNVSAALVRESTHAVGAPVRDAAETLTVRVAVSGRVHRVGYRRWMARAARQLDLVGWVRNAEPDQVEALIHGPATQVGLMLRLAFVGPAAASVVETCAEPVDVSPPASFSIRNDPGR